MHFIYASFLLDCDTLDDRDHRISLCVLPSTEIGTLELLSKCLNRFSKTKYDTKKILNFELPGT